MREAAAAGWGDGGEGAAGPGLSAPRPRVRACFSGVSSAHTPHRAPPRFLSFVLNHSPPATAGPASGSVGLSSSFPPQDLGPMPFLPPEMVFFHLPLVSFHSSSQSLRLRREALP